LGMTSVRFLASAVTAKQPSIADSEVRFAVKRIGPDRANFKTVHARVLQLLRASVRR
jgi:hypothetical protein